MKVLVQRVSRASVTVVDHGAPREVARIDCGMLIFVGVERGDGSEQARAAAEKLATLRIFADADGKMNLDLGQARGSALVVSQFTLAGSLRRGRRPSFDTAAPPDAARELVDLVAAELERRGVAVQCGVFGVDMKVELLNDGPVTFLLDLPVPAAPAGAASPA